MDTEAFFKITYGLYIVSSGSQNKRGGYISNTVFQVSSQPPQIAVACNKDNFTSSLINESGVFSISVLKQEASSELIGLFGYKSGKDIDKFESTGFVTASSGAPIVIDDTIAWFDCKLVNQLDVGTHIIFIGEIIETKLLIADGEPLTYDYYRNVKKGIAPKNAPTYIEHDSKTVELETTNIGSKYRCLVCNYIYDPAEGDPDGGIDPGTSFEDIPDDWFCPVCGATKGDFEIIT